MNIIEVTEPLNDSLRDLTEDVDTDWTNLFRDGIERAGKAVSNLLVKFDGGRRFTRSPCIPCT